MDQYKVVGRIGEGAHGLVLRAKHKSTGNEVALKKLLLKRMDDGIPIQILREIKALQEIECQYVISLLDVFPQGLGFVLVFEYMPTGLWEMIRDVKNPLMEAQIKSYMEMLLKGVDHLHSHGIMHRDLKPANLLISHTGELKIADLGQARLFDTQSNQKRPYSHQVATRWYRAPELLYGARLYTHAVDLWAVGCILAEMFNRSPLFPGESDIDQLCVVLRTLGSPTTKDWPGLSKLPDYNKITFPHTPALPFEQIIPDAHPQTVDLARNFLVYNPDKRIQAKEALVHSYFFTNPLPLPLADMPKPLDDHRHQFKMQEYDIDKPAYTLLDGLRDLVL